jgi:hypothetical protein
MNKSELRFPGFDAASEHGPIRWELFLDWDVRAVLQTPRRDTLLILHRGTADPERWSAILRDAGFPTPQVVAPEAANQSDVAA